MSKQFSDRPARPRNSGLTSKSESATRKGAGVAGRSVAKFRRRTCFPLYGRELHRQRAFWAWRMFYDGHSFREIRQIMNLSGPDKARGLVAKAGRLEIGGFYA